VHRERQLQTLLALQCLVDVVFGIPALPHSGVLTLSSSIYLQNCLCIHLHVHFITPLALWNKRRPHAAAALSRYADHNQTFIFSLAWRFPRPQY